MHLYIKNLVCKRCKMVVKDILFKFGVNPKSVEFGEVEIGEDPDNERKDELNRILKSHGFELIGDKKSKLIEKIKNSIIEIVHYSKNQCALIFLNI